MLNDKISYQVTELEKENVKLHAQIRLLYAALEKQPEKKPKNCAQCRYYIKHYVFVRGKFDETSRGHCIHGRSVKSKNQDDTCKYFELGDYDAEH